MYAASILKDNGDYHLAGTQGCCFQEGKKVIKIYHEPLEKFEKDDLTGFRSTRIAFPKYYLMQNDKIYGEVMPYFKGKTMNKGIGTKTNLFSFIFNYEEIIDEIKYFSDVRMSDIGFYENVLYLPVNGFYLIDTTSWTIEKNQDERNIRFFNNSVVSHLFKIIFGFSINFLVLRELRDNYQHLYQDNIGREFMRVLQSNANNDYHVVELLEAYKELIKSYYDYEVETIGDIKKYTKMMKNS